MTEVFLNKINDYSLHDQDSLLTCKSTIKSIVKILNKSVIPRYLYDKYQFFYDKRNVKPYTN